MHRFLLLVFALILIWLCVPTDVYYHQTLISGFLYKIVTTLNNIFPPFPSALVFALQSQHFIGFTRFLAHSPALLLLVCLPLNPLPLVEIVYNLSNHNIDSYLWTPVVLLVFTIFGKRKYYFLSFLTGIFITFPWWSVYLEELYYFRGYLFWTPIHYFDRLPFLIFTTGFLVLFTNIKKAIIWGLVSYFLINTLLVPTADKWIWAAKDTNDQYLVFEKEFYWPQIISRQGKVDITANSEYKLFVNENFIGEGPGPIDDNFRSYDEYDISKALIIGKNKIRILAHNFGHDTHFQKKQTGGVWVGSSFNLASDRTWKVTSDTGWKAVDLATTKIKDFEINSGIYREEYDFSPINPKFVRATEHPVMARDNLVKRQLPPLTHEQIIPKQMSLRGGELWFEFEDTVSGYPTFDFEVPTKGAITVQYFEDDKVGLMVQEDRFTFSQKGQYKHRIFGRRGLRLVKVVFEDVPLSSKVSLSVDAVHFPAVKSGSFNTSETQLVRMYELGEKTLKYAAQDQLEDSFVHERSQYLGDAYVDMLSGFYSLDVTALARKSLYQFASSQKTDGVIETVYPSGLNQTIVSYNLMFNSFLKDYYLYTGDLKTVKDLTPKGEKLLLGLEKAINDEGLIDSWRFKRLSYNGELIGWIDHLSEQGPYPNETIFFNARYYQELNSLISLLKITAPQKVQAYVDSRDNIRRNLLRHLENYPGKVDPWAAVALINSGVLNPEQERELYDRSLRESFRPFITGYYDLFYLLAAQKMGDEDGARRVMDQQWGGMLSLGAHMTWDIYDPTIVDYLPTSKTHAWSSGATYFLPAFVVGIRPIEPGFSKILVKPILFSQDDVSAEITTACGKITVAWQQSMNKFSLDLVKSCSSEVVYTLPFDSNMVGKLTVNGKVTEPKFVDGQLVLVTNENKIHLDLEKSF